MNKKNISLIVFSTFAISAVAFFMQNCAQSSSTSAVVETATPVVIVSSTTADINLAEGSTADFAISLNASPSASVSMTATSSNSSIATAVPASLSFTPSNWNVPQTITLTGTEDDNTVNEDATVTVVSLGLPTVTLNIHVTDNDTLALHTSVSTVNLNENATTTFTVKLSAQPSSSVTVNLSSPDTVAALVSPASMTFTPANWNTPQTATVTGVDDVDITDEAVSLAVASPGLTTLNVSAQVVDDDILTIVTDLTTVAVSEGATASLGVKLSAQPPANTNVALASLDTGAATVSPSTLSFTPANWSTYQYAVISGVADADTANETTSLQLTSTAVPNKNVAVNVTDTTPITLPLGNYCATDSACASGFCSDGVCCESRCGGTCEKCNQTSRFGRCDPIAANVDPDAECSTMSASTCQRTGQCSGSRSCALYPSGTICNAAVCSGGNSYPADTCNGSGTCVDSGMVACNFIGCNPADGLCID